MAAHTARGSSQTIARATMTQHTAKQNENTAGAHSCYTPLMPARISRHCTAQSLDTGVSRVHTHAPATDTDIQTSKIQGALASLPSPPPALGGLAPLLLLRFSQAWMASRIQSCRQCWMASGTENCVRGAGGQWRYACERPRVKKPIPHEGTCVCSAHTRHVSRLWCARTARACEGYAYPGAVALGPLRPAFQLLGHVHHEHVRLAVPLPVRQPRLAAAEFKLPQHRLLHDRRVRACACNPMPHCTCKWLAGWMAGWRSAAGGTHACVHAARHACTPRTSRMPRTPASSTVSRRAASSMDSSSSQPPCSRQQQAAAGSGKLFGEGAN